MTVSPSAAQRSTKPSSVKAMMSAIPFLALMGVVLVPLVQARLAEKGPVLPALASEPMQLHPQFDDPRVVSDEQLHRVLKRLEPRLAEPRPKINHVDHALRFWGAEANFDSKESLSGSQMRQMLIDHSHYVEAWGARARPLLVPSDRGVQVRVQQGPNTASHVDHTLATLAEVGTSLDHPILTFQGPSSLESVLHEAVQTFSLNQREYEWTTLALCLYAKNSDPWYSREGQEITYDRLADRLMRQQFSQGVCYGNHRLYTLVIMLRVDERIHILSRETRERIHEFLQRATRQLVSNQSEEGFWDETWAADTEPSSESSPDDLLSHRLLATGHALEWWAMAPEELLPPREVIIRASQWMVSQIDTMSDEQIASNYTFLSHAGKALALWRGETPAVFMSRLTNKQGDAS